MDPRKDLLLREGGGSGDGGPVTQDSCPGGVVPPALLRSRCRAEEFTFRSTAELSDAPIGILQRRALAALDLGVRIDSRTHNVYVMGEPGSGRHAIVRRALEEEAKTRPPPVDWCYVNRFNDPQRPRAMRLPQGRGRAFKADMQELVRDIRAALPDAIESEAHRQRHTEVERALEERIRKSLEAIQQEAERSDLTLLQSPEGFVIAPVRRGEVLSPEAFAKLPEEERARTRERIEVVSDMLRKHVESVPLWQRDRYRKLRDLDREITQTTVRVHIEGLRVKYSDCPDVLDHLTGVEADLVENAGSALRSEPSPALAALGLSGASRSERSRYDVNVLIDGGTVSDGGGTASGAPVVYEGNPTYQNLLGQIESIAQLGTLTTDFMLVRAGALHRANGGFLILDAERLLSQAYSWEALKHALFERAVRIESLGQHLSLISTLSLEPDRIPLEVRVVLIGSRRTYELLSAFDPEFAGLFKVAADFDDTVERNPANIQLYAQMIAGSIRRESLRPLEAAAVARLVEHGSRLAGDSRKLSTHWRSIDDSLREASHFAAMSGRDIVGAADVEQALDEQWKRLARTHEETLDTIRSRVRLIDCDGLAIGQINGLSVIAIGPMLFGQPSRITATVRIGEGEVIDIEREVKLGGAIHSKGVLILSSLIGSRLGARLPLSVQASLTFEQSYGGVEGDSASLAEACALLSAISDVPLRQSLGVTGSINQHGVVQVVGGVNEKIEGFFEVCRVGGLTGTQGVIIPWDNVPHLMLHDEVILAVEQSRFHLFAVRTLDEALTLLTGLSPGERQPSGEFPEGSFNARIEHRLREFLEIRRKFARESPGG